MRSPFKLIVQGMFPYTIIVVLLTPYYLVKDGFTHFLTRSSLTGSGPYVLPSVRLYFLPI